MNAKKFTPRAYPLVCSLIILALFLSACSGILPEKPNVPPSQAVQACSIGSPEAVIIDGRRWNCADLVSAPPAATSPAPAATAPLSVATTAAPGAPAPSGGCRDGNPTGNDLNKIDRTPVGRAEVFTVQEISVKPGKGFAGFSRWVQVTAPLANTHQVFNENVETIHEVEYCGDEAAVKAYLSDKSTHVWAMRQSAADGAGNIPPEGEIPVVFINTTTGEITFLVAPTAATAPTLATIKSHIEVVALTSAVAPTSAPVVVSVSPTTVPAPAASCGPATEIDLGPWEAKDRSVSGLTIVNFGFPNEGTTLYRTMVPTGVSATFLAAAGKAWKFDPGCPVAEIQRQLTANAGGLTIVSLDDLVAQGKASK